MSFHIDYRPDNLSTFFGNEIEVEKLETVLIRETDVPQTFLFQGPKGCGKTTLARIAAKTVGCHEQDVMEIDVTTSRGIDSAKELKSSLSYLPMYGKSKAYILDEVHQGTAAFFNALLKPLEEPPKHVYFFLCTTDPQKVLGTVTSRCFIFNVEPLSKKETTALIEFVLEDQQVELESEHIKQIVSASEGIPREALIMLDSVIDLPSDAIEKAVAKIKTQEKQIKDLCQALLEQKKWKVIAEIIKAIKEEDEKTRRSVLGYMSAVLLSGKEGTNAASIIEEFSEPFYNTGKAGLVKACYLSIL